MKVHSSTYIASYPSLDLCPKGDLPEYAFIGRSNVGKSSLINMLCDRKNLAHTSKKPGKTQMINYYLINEEWHLVDLPGYGYAKISKKMRMKWRVMIEKYLSKRLNLQCAFVLIDANVPPQAIDLEFINWLGQYRVPFAIVYTKADRAKPNVLTANIENFQKAMLESWEAMPEEFVTSAEKQMGQDALLSYINSINDIYFQTVN